MVKVVYDDHDRVAGLFFLPGEARWSPPPYALLDTFEEVRVEVGGSPALPGTLVMPRGEGPFPAVVLVHGSGPNDEDETIGEIKVFKDLALGLASQKIAVLRYIKRTRYAPRGVRTQKEEVLDPARDAVTLLLGTQRIDPERVVVLGHSQGGYLAPRMAKEDPRIAGIVILAGPTRPIQDSLLDQLRYYQSLEPGNTALAVQLEAARRFKVEAEDPLLTPEKEIAVPMGGKLTGAYFLDVRDYRPAEIAATLDRPMLILQGDRDSQVSRADYDGWAAVGKRPLATLKRYPALNHAFVAGTGTSVPAEYQLPGHVEESVVKDIVAWMKGLPTKRP